MPEPVGASDWIQKAFSPPFLLSLATSCQSWAGKLAVLDVSVKSIRRLFSFSRSVSKPKASPAVQSLPTHRLPVIDPVPP